MRLIPFLCLLPCLALAKETPVTDVAEFDAAVASAAPGDVIVLSEGEWRDAKLRFTANGTPAAPVMLRAEAPGKTILTGASQLLIGGRHLLVSGLWFKDPNPSVGDTIEFRAGSKHLASHCRLTECAITLEPGAGGKEDKESRWLGLYGESNRVDHCLIQGKTNKGATLVVWLGSGQAARHRIDHNFFGPRQRLGENGGETIRVGDSNTSMETAACIVEHNRFERCDGEAECISNKSCGNIYRDNSFIAVSGTLTLRHGNGCLVERNVFLGQKQAGTGGIRIIGEDHVVRANYLEGLTGDDVRSGITFMQGVQNSPLNGYFQVQRARVEGNTLIDCEHPILIGMVGDKTRLPSLPPVDCVIARNVVVAPKAAVVEARCSTEGIRWEQNSFWGKELGIPPTDGIVWQEKATTAPQPISRKDVGPGWHE